MIILKLSFLKSALTEKEKSSFGLLLGYLCGTPRLCLSD